MTTEADAREWNEHNKDHEREHRVAEDTARRLEREVEGTATRIQDGVQSALVAVAETARVHAEAHNREHLAHERIHAVEKVQVDKAEEAMNRRLEGMNEFRAQLTNQANHFVSRELFDAQEKRITQIEKRMAYYAGAGAVLGAVIATVIRSVQSGVT